MAGHVLADRFLQRDHPLASRTPAAWPARDVSALTSIDTPSSEEFRFKRIDSIIVQRELRTEADQRSILLNLICFARRLPRHQPEPNS